MASLKDEEIRRFISFLKFIVDEERMLAIEAELRDEDGEDFIREPEFLSFFEETLIEFGKWRLKIIPYTRMRMIQRGIKTEAIINIFERFIDYCRLNDETIIVGAYSIISKTGKKTVTLRIDVDEVTDEKGQAHTVTVFVGHGNTENSVFLFLEK